MVTRYYVISSRWSSHFWVKMHVFSPFSTIKVKLVDESSYLCVILHVKHKKIPFIAILTWFLILGKIEDGDHCWWRHLPSAAPPPIKYTSSCWEDQRLSTKGEIVSKYCNRSKTLSSTPPHPTFIPPLYHSGGMSLRVRLRVKLLIKSSAGRKNQKSSHLIKLPIFY